MVCSIVAHPIGTGRRVRDKPYKYYNSHSKEFLKLNLDVRPCLAQPVCRRALVTVWCPRADKGKRAVQQRRGVSQWLHALSYCSVVTTDSGSVVVFGVAKKTSPGLSIHVVKFLTHMSIPEFPNCNALVTSTEHGELYKSADNQSQNLEMSGTHSHENITMLRSTY